MDKKELELIAELSKSEGGKYLAERSKETIVNLIDVLINTYKDKTIVEMQAMLSKVEANLAIYKLLTGIEKQIEQIKELYKDESTH